MNSPRGLEDDERVKEDTGHVDQRKWRSVFPKINNMGKRGTKLSYLALVEQKGVQIARLESEEAHKVSGKKDLTFVLFVVRVKP